MQTVPVNCYCFAVGVTGQSYSGKPAHPVRKNSHFFYWRLDKEWLLDIGLCK